MPEGGLQKKLDETYKLARENNKMLRGMRRAAFWGTVFKLLFWAVMLGIPLYLYFTVFQPVMAQFMEAYSQLQATGAQIQNAGSQLQGITDSIPLDQLQELLENVPGFGAPAEVAE